MRQTSDTNIAVLTARRKLSCMPGETTTVSQPQRLSSGWCI